MSLLCEARVEVRPVIFANESMSESTRRDHLVSALKEDLPALTVEVGLLYLEESPEDAWALGVVGQALFYMARYGEAEAMYARALIGVEPHRRRRLLNQLGDLKAAQLDFAEAERFYREAMVAEPDNAAAYIFLGAMLAKRGDLRAAEEVHRRGTACTQGCIDEAYLNLGYVLRAQRRYVEALECFRESLALDPLDKDTQEALRDMEAVLFGFPEA